MFKFFKDIIVTTNDHLIIEKCKKKNTFIKRSYKLSAQELIKSVFVDLIKI